MNSVNEEGLIVERSKQLLANDRLGSLEGKGRLKSSLVSEEVKATENSLKALQAALNVDPLRNNRKADLDFLDPPPQQATISPRRFNGLRDVLGESFESGVGENGEARTYLSKEAQMKIAAICAPRSEPRVSPPPQRPVDVLDSIIADLRASRASTLIVHPIEVIPNPELASISVNERRALAPHVSSIYDQIFLEDQVMVDEEVAALLGPRYPGPFLTEHPRSYPAATARGPARIWGTPCVRCPQGDQEIVLPPAHRNTEGFWVHCRDDKSALVSPHGRTVGYGTVQVRDGGWWAPWSGARRLSAVAGGICGAAVVALLVWQLWAVWFPSDGSAPPPTEPAVAVT